MYKDLKINTPDGYCLKAWFLPAQTILSKGEIQKLKKENRKRIYKLEDTGPKPTIIICVGDAGNMSNKVHLAYQYAGKGFNVVLFDWRGFGESSGFPINGDNLFYNEFLIDYCSVIDEVNKLPEVKKNCIGLFGYSTGAYLSFAAAYKNPRVKAVVARALITSFDDVIPLLKKLKSEVGRSIIIPKNYDIRFEPINIADSFEKSVLLVVGSEDKRTPVDMSRKIYEKLQGTKDFWIVKGAGHGGRSAPEEVNQPEFVRRTVAFYRDCLK